MGLFRKKDPLPLFISGDINEYKFNKALDKLKPEDVTDFNLEKWRDFILEKNLICAGHFPILDYLTKMISLIKRDDILVDIAVKGYGDDIISTEAVRYISKQDSLQKVLEAFNCDSPFHSYSDYCGHFKYNAFSWGPPQFRGGRLMYVLLKRIDVEHFNAALENCNGEMKWLDDTRSGQLKYWTFYEGKKYDYKYDDIYSLAKERGFLE